MANDGQRPADTPIPDAPPPDFHRPAKRRAAKPYALEWRCLRGPFATIKGFREWGTLKRYAKMEQAMEAFATHERKEGGRFGRGGFRPRSSQYRVVGPDGVLATTEDQ